MQVALDVDHLDEEEGGLKAYRQVYLVTLPHPLRAVSCDGVPLLPPSNFTKGQIMEKFLVCMHEPIYVDANHRDGGGSVEVVRAGVWWELHKQVGDGVPPKPHDHLAVLTARQLRYMPVKRALLQKFGLASHWSCTHTGYWSAVRYLAMPSPKKPLAALDSSPVLWPADGRHPPVSECCHEPLTAAALRKRRLHAEAEAAEAGEGDPKVREMDVWPIVVQQGFRNTPDTQHADMELISYAKTHCSPAMQAFLFSLSRRQRLASLIDDIWRWEEIDSSLEKARLNRLGALRSAAGQPCVCQGRWKQTALSVFEKNNIKVDDVCRDVHRALMVGRSEQTHVVVFAGLQGGEGKSLFFKGLSSCFGHDFTFGSPPKGNFPLVDLPGKKVVFLDDWRFDATVIPFATQCLWYDGSPLPIAQPQNQPGKSGHL